MRFPKRTLILLVLALLAFCWMFWRTHFGAAQTAPLKAHSVEFISIVSPGGDQ